MNKKNMVGKLLADIKNSIEFHGALGFERYPASKKLRDFLEIIPEQKKPTLPHARNIDESVEKEGLGKRSGGQGTLKEVRLEIGDCTRCALHEKRSRILFGAGNTKADLFIVGEWPNFNDDSEGVLFSGEQGNLLAKMLKAIGLDVDDVYMTNVVKCRASEETPPCSEHIKECLPFLMNQIDIVAPKVICTMGPLAAHTLLKTNKLLIRLRGRFHTFKGIPVLPTYHPSFLIKNPEMKKATWVDLQLIQQKLINT